MSFNEIRQIPALVVRDTNHRMAGIAGSLR